MRVLFFSDLHNDLNALRRLINASRETDLVICAGDLTNKERNLKEIINELRVINNKLIIIPGNNESINSLRSECENNNITFLHNNVIKIDKYNIAGIGGCLKRPELINAFNQLTEHELRVILNNFKGLSNLILVTHSPPRNSLGLTKYGYNIGSESILEFIKSEQPLISVCGHVHETAGKEELIGNTRVINAGKKGVIIDL